jgi:hypothetical protein
MMNLPSEKVNRRPSGAVLDWPQASPASGGGIAFTAGCGL